MMPRPRAAAGDVCSSRFHSSARTRRWNHIDESVVPLRWLRERIVRPCTPSAGSIPYRSVMYSATMVCSSASSGSAVVTRHQNRRVNPPPAVSSAMRMSNSSSGSDGAGPGGPVRGNASGSCGTLVRRPCSGPGSGVANDTVAVVSNRPCSWASTRRANAVRPS